MLWLNKDLSNLYYFFGCHLCSDFVYINSGISHAPTKKKKSCGIFCKLCEFWLMKIWILSSSYEGIKKQAVGPVCSSATERFLVAFFIYQGIVSLGTCLLYMYLSYKRNIFAINHYINEIIFQKTRSHEESYNDSNCLKYWKHLLIVEFYTNLGRYINGHNKMCSYCLKIFTEIQT